MTGGRIAGCFFTLADKPDSPLVICEGYATGASIHEATGYAVVCAMNCGNLLAVAKALREKLPTRDIIIGADNDQLTDGNPGLTKATEAAKTIGARLAVPQFKRPPPSQPILTTCTNWKDSNTMKDQIEGAKCQRNPTTNFCNDWRRCRRWNTNAAETRKPSGWASRVSILDKMVDAKRPKIGAQDETFKVGR